MNIKTVDIVTERLPYCPVTNKDNRVLTKHFTNLIYHKDKNLIGLLGFLVYESGSDNRINYSQLLISKYCLSVKSAKNYYKSELTGKKLLSNPITIRGLFRKLISDGYIICVNSELYVNPMFSYRSDYISKRSYKTWCELYQQGDKHKFMTYWVKTIGKVVRREK